MTSNILSQSVNLLLDKKIISCGCPTTSIHKMLTLSHYLIKQITDPLLLGMGQYGTKSCGVVSIGSKSVKSCDVMLLDIIVFVCIESLS